MPSYFEELTEIKRLSKENGTKEELDIIFLTLSNISSEQPFQFVKCSSFIDIVVQTIKELCYMHSVKSLKIFLKSLADTLIKCPEEMEIFIKRTIFLIEDLSFFASKDFESLTTLFMNESRSFKSVFQAELTDDPIIDIFISRISVENDNHLPLDKFEEILTFFSILLKNKNDFNLPSAAFSYLDFFEVLIKKTLTSPEVCQSVLSFIDTLPQLKLQLIERDTFKNIITPLNTWRDSIAPSKSYLATFSAPFFEEPLNVFSPFFPEISVFFEMIILQDAETQLEFLQCNSLSEALIRSQDITFYHSFLRFFNSLTINAKEKWSEEKAFHDIYHSLLTSLKVNFSQALCNDMIVAAQFLPTNLAETSSENFSDISLEFFLDSIRDLPFEKDSVLLLVVTIANHLPSLSILESTKDKTKKIHTLLSFLSIILVYPSYEDSQINNPDFLFDLYYNFSKQLIVEIFNTEFDIENKLNFFKLLLEIITDSLSESLIPLVLPEDNIQRRLGYMLATAARETNNHEKDTQRWEKLQKFIDLSSKFLKNDKWLIKLFASLIKEAKNTGNSAYFSRIITLIQTRPSEEKMSLLTNKDNDGFLHTMTNESEDSALFRFFTTLINELSSNEKKQEICYDFLTAKSAKEKKVFLISLFNALNITLPNIHFLYEKFNGSRSFDVFIEIWAAALPNKTESIDFFLLQCPSETLFNATQEKKWLKSLLRDNPSFLCKVCHILDEAKQLEFLENYFRTTPTIILDETTLSDFHQHFNKSEQTPNPVFSIRLRNILYPQWFIYPLNEDRITTLKKFIDFSIPENLEYYRNNIIRWLNDCELIDELTPYLNFNEKISCKVTFFWTPKEFTLAEYFSEKIVAVTLEELDAITNMLISLSTTNNTMKHQPLLLSAVECVELINSAIMSSFSLEQNVAKKTTRELGIKNYCDEKLSKLESQEVRNKSSDFCDKSPISVGNNRLSERILKFR